MSVLFHVSGNQMISPNRVIANLDSLSHRLNLVYLTFMLHGIGTLMPWNMFITAKDVRRAEKNCTWHCLIFVVFFFQYFVDYKLSASYTGEQQSAFAANFLPYLGFASQVPNVIFNWLNIFVQIGYVTLCLPPVHGS